MAHDTQDHAGPQPVGTSFVPLAEPIPNPEPGLLPPFPVPPFPIPTPGPFPVPQPFPFPPLHVCRIDLRAGCYRIAFTPNSGFGSFQGTMRVDHDGGGTTISGDLYRFLPLPFPGPPTPFPPFPPFPPLSLGIPIYPRRRYFSYLKLTAIHQSPPITTGPCNVTLTMEEYRYTQPSAGSFDGTFALNRTVTIVLSPQAAPAGFTGPFFSGNLMEGAVNRGTFTMGWVSPFFRKATVEIDTLTGAVAPAPVPASSGTGTEDFQTVFATAGWELTVIRDQTSVPVPAGVNPTDCWSAGSLHQVMQSARNPATNLDQEWRMHVLVVPAKLGCGRGVMYDTIDVPREGVASFSDDGYPPADSPNFGVAANKKQRDVPRAFLRSACHEIGHGFNQQHQEITSFGEPGADNSIMTTSPGVANVLGGPATGAPGVFPTEIALRFNGHVRHHLIHFPDPVVRPGGMTFGTGHNTSVPEEDEDRYYFAPEELELTLAPSSMRVKLGQPLPVSWQIVNNSAVPIPAPNDLRVEAQHAQITVVDPNHVAERVPSYVIQTDRVAIQELKPGDSLQADTTLFWSSHGFAFEVPGRHQIDLQITWNYGGIPYGVKTRQEIWVDYPVTEADNEVAAHLLHEEVGKFVALGGNAPHLTEGVARIEAAISQHPKHPASACLAEYRGHKQSRRAK